MKKIFAFLLVLTLAFTMFACSTVPSEDDNEVGAGGVEDGVTGGGTGTGGEDVEDEIRTVTDYKGITITLGNKPQRVAIVGVPELVVFYVQTIRETALLVTIPDVSVNENSGDLYDIVWVGMEDIDKKSDTVDNIMSTEPDIILCDADSDKYDELVSSNITTVAFSYSEDSYLTDCNKWISMLGDIFQKDVSKIIANNNRLSNTVSSIKQQISDKKTGVVLSELSDSDFTRTGDYWLDKVGISPLELDSSSLESLLTVSESVDVVLVPYDMDTASLYGVYGEKIMNCQVGLIDMTGMSPDVALYQLWVGKQVYGDLYASINIASEISTHYENFNTAW